MGLVWGHHIYEANSPTSKKSCKRKIMQTIDTPSMRIVFIAVSNSTGV